MNIRNLIEELKTYEQSLPVVINNGELYRGISFKDISIEKNIILSNGRKVGNSLVIGF